PLRFSSRFPYTTLFRSLLIEPNKGAFVASELPVIGRGQGKLLDYPAQTGFSFKTSIILDHFTEPNTCGYLFTDGTPDIRLTQLRSEEHTSELQSRENLV